MSLDFLSPFQGEAAALTAALMWAIASTVYGHLGKQIPPLMLNLIKGAMAIVLLLLTLLIRQEGWVAIPETSFVLLLLSGAVGIGLGDTFFFESLNYIGARKALLMEALAPALSAIVAAIFLGEKLEPLSWL
ncbi:MAG: DMT family transporter, partial [Leptolyngbyaceae cyanobacterium bins.59]|nr:DMT family transporter [Leptolyngbyaceae cyanobacterium bins.59]